MRKLCILNLLFILSVLSSGCDFEPAKDNSDVKQDAHRTYAERIAFKEIGRRLAEGSVEKLEDVPIRSNETEVRVWLAFDATPLRGIMLRRSEYKFSASFLEANPLKRKTQGNPRTLGSPDQGWEQFWRQLERAETSAASSDCGMVGAGESLDAKLVVVEYKSGIRYRSTIMIIEPSNRLKCEQTQTVYEFLRYVERAFKIELMPWETRPY